MFWIMLTAVTIGVIGEGIIVTFWIKCEQNYREMRKCK